MTVEPYICKKGVNLGSIYWLAKHPDGKLFAIRPRYQTCDLECYDTTEWQPYADFEREKLKELTTQLESIKSCDIETRKDGFYLMAILHVGRISHVYWSETTIGYGHNIGEDSESGRLLKRAEFLKAVCEKEGVDYLPKEKKEICTRCGCTPFDWCRRAGTVVEVTGSCHKKPEVSSQTFCGCDNPSWVPSQFCGQFCTNCKKHVNPLDKPEKCEHKRMTPMQIRHDRPCPDCKRSPFWDLGENIDYRTCKPEEPREPEKESLPFGIVENRRCKCDDIQMHDPCEKCPECEGVRKCRERDYYTRAEIDEKVTSLIDAVQLLSEAIEEQEKRKEKAQELSYKCRKIMEEKKDKEEREWRKELLDFLAIPNSGIFQGEHIDRKDYQNEFEVLRRKFT